MRWSYLTLLFAGSPVIVESGEHVYSPLDPSRYDLGPQVFAHWRFHVLSDGIPPMLLAGVLMILLAWTGVRDGRTAAFLALALGGILFVPLPLLAAWMHGPVHHPTEMPYLWVAAVATTALRVVQLRISEFLRAPDK